MSPELIHADAVRDYYAGTGVLPCEWCGRCGECPCITDAVTVHRAKLAVHRSHRQAVARAAGPYAPVASPTPTDALDEAQRRTERRLRPSLRSIRRAA